MRFLLRLTLLFIFALPLILAGIVFLAIEDQPAVNRVAEITPDNIGRAKRILDKNDPRNLKPGVVRTISVSEPDLDVAANYLAHQYGQGSAQIVATDGAINLTASLPLPRNPVGRYLNLKAILRQSSALLSLERLEIGRVALPGWLAAWLCDRALAVFLGDEAYHSLRSALQQVSVSEGKVAVS